MSRGRRVEPFDGMTMAQLRETWTEAELLSALRARARGEGWLFYHTWRSDRSDPGFPDVVMARRDRLIFAELKAQRGQPSGDQVRWLAALGAVGERSAGTVRAALWRPSDWEAIEEALA